MTLILGQTKITNPGWGPIFIDNRGLRTLVGRHEGRALIGKGKGIRGVILLGGYDPIYTSHSGIFLTLDVVMIIVREKYCIIRLIKPVRKLLLLPCLTSLHLICVTALRWEIGHLGSDQVVVLASVWNMPFVSHTCHKILYLFKILNYYNK